MAKRKISSKDFLDLLDDQEVSKEKPAFKPTHAKRSKSGKSSVMASATSTLRGPKTQTTTATTKGFQLTPMQREWIAFAFSTTPGFVKSMVTSDRALNMLEMVYASLDEAIAALYRMRASRAKA